jgi:hypothetical protein
MLYEEEMISWEDPYHLLKEQDDPGASQMARDHHLF